jgi:hypothetical protein
MYSKGNYYIYDDRDKIQFDEVKSLLKQSYWANDRDVETIQISINNSIYFSLFHNNKQVGFGRVVTDFASVAYISDVIIDSKHRTEGLGKWLYQFD